MLAKLIRITCTTQNVFCSTYLLIHVWFAYLRSMLFRRWNSVCLESRHKSFYALSWSKSSFVYFALLTEISAYWVMIEEDWEKETILTIVKRRKLQWYGHVFRSLGLAKTILQGTVNGRRRQDRQRERWEDNIREWTGLEFGRSEGAVENSERWRKLVAKSSVVPQRPSRLKNRW